MEKLGGYQPPYVQNSFGQLNKTHKSKRRRWPWVFLFISVALYVACVSFWPTPKVSAKLNKISVPAESVTVPFPAYGSSAVGVVGGGVIAKSANQKPAPIASTAKIMTALAIMKQKPLRPGEQGPTITIDQADVDYFNKQVFEGGSTVPVTLGQQITQRKALEMLLIPSANNIAFALSRWAFGTPENYTKFANAYAKELGANSSNFTDPSGYDPATVSTAHDLVILGEELMQNKVLAEIVKMKRVDLGNGSSLPSTNSFLTLKPDVIGVKTGHHDEAGGCFVVAVETMAGGQPITVISAVMNAPNLIQAMNDSYTVASAFSSQITERLAINAEQVIGRYSAPWGAQADAAVPLDLSVLAWKGTELATQAVLLQIEPSSAGDVVGKAHATSVNGKTHPIEVKLQQNFYSPSFWWRITHPLKIFMQ